MYRWEIKMEDRIKSHDIKEASEGSKIGKGCDYTSVLQKTNLCIEWTEGGGKEGNGVSQKTLSVGRSAGQR